MFASLARTYVSMAVGVVVAWFAARGFEVDPATQVAAIAGLTGLASALYYTIARAVEARWPRLGGILLTLGLSSQQPVYVRAGGPAPLTRADLQALATGLARQAQEPRDAGH